MVSSLKPQQVIQIINSKEGVLVDVRAAADWLDGVPSGALCMSQAALMAESEALLEAHKRIFIICYKGQTSARIVRQLNVGNGGVFCSVDGGYAAWSDSDLPVEIPNIEAHAHRYDRQVKIKGFGQKAQKKLSQSHVLVIGAGGLGTPALMYLAGCGVGELTLVDKDTVALHNLHRQILYTEDDIGSSKVLVAEQRLKQLNSSIQINACDECLNAENVEALMAGVDLVLDGSDNISTRYLINEFSLKLCKPWIYAAVSGFHIQLTLFSGEKSMPCYRCLFPALEEGDVGNCSDEGILGPVPGIAAMLQTTEAIKFLTGVGPAIQQQMLSYDLLNHQFKVLKYPANKSKSCEH